jgi:hypothetical protein
MQVSEDIISVPSPGTPVQVDSAGQYSPVASAEFQVIDAAVGDITIKDSGGNTLKVLLDNASGTPEVWRLPLGEGNVHHMNEYYVDSEAVLAGNKNISNIADNGSLGIRVTANAHGYTTGDRIKISGVVGTGGITTYLNGTYWTITVINANTFDLNTAVWDDQTPFVYSSGGVANKATVQSIRVITWRQ